MFNKINFMGGLATFVRRRARLIVVVVAVLTVGFGGWLRNLKIEAEITRMMPAGDAGVAVLRTVDSEFGGSEQVLVLIESESLFTPPVLAGIDSLTAGLKKLAAVNEVVALTSLQDVRGRGDEVVISRLIESIPVDDAGLVALKNRVLTDKRYRGRLVAADGSSTLLLVRLVPGVDRKEAVKAIESLVKKSGLFKRVSLAGSPALMEYVRRWMVQDLLKLIPLVIGMLISVLCFTTRTWSGVLLPLLSVLIAVIWTMGLVGLFRQPLTVVMIVLPPILLAVGSAYGIHIVERWQQETQNGADEKQRVERVVGKTGLPVLLAMLTTAAGFASNLVMKVVAIRVFAIFAVLGVIFSFVLAVLFVPALMSIIPFKNPNSRVNFRINSSRRAHLFRRFTGWIIKNRIAVLATTGVLTLVALGFGTRVKPETDFVRYFKAGSEPTRAAEVVNEQFGGELQFEILVAGDIQEPALLQQVERFVADLQQVPHITHISSLVEVLKSTNRAFHQDLPEYERLPESRDEVAQLLLLLSFSGSDYLASLVTSDYRLTRITAQFNRHSSAELGQAITRIKELIKKDFGSNVQVRLGGVPLAIYGLHQGIASSQLGSIIAALLAVILLVALMFRSVRLGLMAVVPVVFTLAMAFGVMGLFKIQVDVVTAMLGSIAVGIGIDYACHLIARLREEETGGGSRQEQLCRAVQGVGPPIIANALAVGLGFAVLGFSSLVIIQKFGILISVAMLFSAIAALVLLPALLVGNNKTKTVKGDKI